MSHSEKLPKETGNNKKKLLVLDTSYSLEDITKRGILNSVLCRDLDGYFDHVWTVHPFATIVTSPKWSDKFGKPVWHELSRRHTFVEGKIGRFAWLKRISIVNFLVGQVGMFFTLRKLIKREKINVIRVGDMLYLGFLGWVLSKICKIPFVVRVGGNHDKIYESTGHPLQKRLFLNRRNEKVVERFVLKRADLVAGANQDNLNFALANGARKEFSTIFRYGNLLYGGHFTEPAKRQEGQSLLNELGISSDAFLLYIGRLESVKHPDHVIKTLSEVRKKGHNVKALLVGGGTMLKELNKMVVSLGLEDHVVFAGNRDQEWLSRIIPLAAIVLSPHTGRALSEAALGAVPIVAYDIDWQGEIIDDNVTGLLVTYPEQDLFNKATERLLNETVFAKQLGEALRKKAIEMLDPRKLNEHEIKEYEKLEKRFS